MWAAIILLLCLVMPKPGGWTVDDGVKRLAAMKGEGLWAERIADGPVRSALSDPGAYPPLVMPYAYRVPGGFAPGFSPFTRALGKALGQNETLYWLLIAISAVLLWALMERFGIPWAFLLLPLTFYALVPWEHVLSWLLLWPAIQQIAGSKDSESRSPALAGILTAPAMLLRPETGLLVGVLAVFLAFRNFRRALIFAGAAAAVMAVLMIWHTTTAEEPLAVHLALNIEGKSNVMTWLSSRPAAFYELLFQMDRNPEWSTAMLVALAMSIWLILKGEVSGRKSWIAAGVALLSVWTALFQYRLWSFPLPPVATMGANSLIATLPWVLVLARPPYRNRSALWLAVVTLFLAILLTPVWKGVHWGPRLLLFVIPLLALDLKQMNRARGILFTVLLSFTALQAASSLALAYARDSELADRCRPLKRSLGSIVICDGSMQCVDLAPLWKGREFFATTTPRQLRQLLIEFRRQGIDTCSLHMEAQDPLWAAAFPDTQPVRQASEQKIAAGSLYRTHWRVLTLAWSKNDTNWTRVLQVEARSLMMESKPDRALALQREAVTLSPQSAQVHHNLALILSALGDIDEARAEVGRALEIDSTLTEARRLSVELSSRSGGIPATGERPPSLDQERPPD